ncbi:MAG TPA: kelch repeat-containing protein, partial [Ktedonobacteraceae bacterium]|nr:kelch repeat-containing protein [Ktedonobacteraceae bacterium]
MMNNDDFSPETVEEQIERFLQVQPREHLNAALTQELKVMCEEDRAVLERVGARYAARINNMPALDAQPAPRSPLSAWTNVGAFSEVPAQQKARPARRSRRVYALVAALLVAAVLVGSVLWAGGTHHQHGVVAHPTMTPQLTRTQASTPTPGVVQPALAPSGRGNAQLVYDDATNSLLLFSGQDYTGAPPLDDTWSWNGSTWTRLHPAHSPGPRDGAAIAYDPTTRQVVLFGGISNANTGGTPILGDTWTWNGSDWMRQHPVNSPPARMEANLAYDATSGQLVLFGGKHITGFNTPDLNDTWTWTGSNWLQQHPATVPPARTQAGLAYDAASGQLVLFGGQNAAFYGIALNDTWTWTGSNWLQQHPDTAPALSATLQGQTVTFTHPSMVYNPIAGKIMLT